MDRLSNYKNLRKLIEALEETMHESSILKGVELFLFTDN